jgi:copper chaperone
MKTENIKIEGMSCGHCIMAVKKELSKLPLKIKNMGVGSAEVEYDESQLSKEDLYNAVQEAGYLVNQN